MTERAGEIGLSFRMRVCVLIAAISMLLVSSFGIAAEHRTALAGGNGQQVQVFQCPGSTQITVWGTNQYGNWTSWTGYTNSWGYVAMNNFWWKGTIVIQRPGRSTTAWVPTWQWGSDWWSVYC